MQVSEAILKNLLISKSVISMIFLKYSTHKSILIRLTSSESRFNCLIGLAIDVSIQIDIDPKHSGIAILFVKSVDH